MCMKNNDNPDVSLRRGVAIVVWLALIALGLGCSKSTDPFGDDDLVGIDFSPKSQGQEITLAEQLDFAVLAPEANVLLVNWLRGGLAVSTDSEYTYTPSGLGADTLRVQVDADGTKKTHFWVVTVKSEPSTSPPLVIGVSAGAGPALGEIGRAHV